MPDMCAFCSLDTGGNHEAGCPVNQTAIYTQAQLDGEIQRIRAEVLASFLNNIEVQEHDADMGRKIYHIVIKGVEPCTGVLATAEQQHLLDETLTKVRASLLRQFQPAASDLEELLRDAELKGLRFAEDALHAANNPFLWANKLNGRIAELEKARAIVMEKS